MCAPVYICALCMYCEYIQCVCCCFIALILSYMALALVQTPFALKVLYTLIKLKDIIETPSSLKQGEKSRRSSETALILLLSSGILRSASPP